MKQLLIALAVLLAPALFAASPSFQQTTNIARYVFTNTALPAAIVTNNATGVTLSGTFSGNGSDLTAGALFGAASVGFINGTNGNDSAIDMNQARLIDLGGFVVSLDWDRRELMVGTNDVRVMYQGDSNALFGAWSLVASQLDATPGSMSGIFNGTFTGDASGLTNINASSLASGTVPDARLSGNVVRTNNPGVVSLTNSANAFTATFTGNGANLTNLNASQLTGNVPLAQLTNVFNGTTAVNGGGLTNISQAAIGATLTNAISTSGSISAVGSIIANGGGFICDINHPVSWAGVGGYVFGYATQGGVNGAIRIVGNNGTAFNFGGDSAAFPGLLRVGGGLKLLGAGGVASGTNNFEISGTITVNGVITSANHLPVAVTVGASPFSFTNTTGVTLKYRMSGATAYSATVDGVAVFGSLAGDVADSLSTNEWLTITYTIAPTLYTNSW